ncbi:thiamine biosynthesis lipoprotein [Arcanobacterium pluranimalium]|uniref:FAD:protein FMN transferase n=1 Tax=Arcanobacterium pluranimalium TaxID=108028 RepID=UPI00195659F6|nr:FAD:protein FMN transferase [Arcanobacterium pluranimalium]MBM7824297.1 thiamine biosynthesis lipoprotein [Arcanobacterium pluranimalium]
MNVELLRANTRARRHSEDIWGTVVTIDVRELPGSVLPADSQIDQAFAECVTFMHDVDATLSTFRYDSAVTAYRSGWRKRYELDRHNRADAMLLEVIEACEWGKAVTQGAFDPWAVPGGFDPSGYVKGWAAEKMALILGEHGIDNFSVNAGGDVVNRGHAGVAGDSVAEAAGTGELVGEAGLYNVGTESKAESTPVPWRIGVRHPDDASAIAASFEVTNAAITTSGTYERGMHIVNPFGANGLRARSATVIGPDAGVAEIASTALVVCGREGAQWFGELGGYSAFGVDTGDTEHAWRIGAWE